jgi:ADP-ribose pyrophosphatase YjhB (NUDIX family)
MTWKPHFTVASILQKDDKFLFVEEISGGQKVLNQPAGHVENSERVFDAVIRETKEETAWDFFPEYIVGIYLWQKPDQSQTYLRVCYAGKVGEHDPLQTLDEGIIRTHWLSLAELKQNIGELRSPMVLQCVEDFIEGKQYPLNLLTDLGEV